MDLGGLWKENLSTCDRSPENLARHAPCRRQGAADLKAAPLPLSPFLQFILIGLGGQKKRFSQVFEGWRVGSHVFFENVRVWNARSEIFLEYEGLEATNRISSSSGGLEGQEFGLSL